MDLKQSPSSSWHMKLLNFEAHSPAWRYLVQVWVLSRHRAQSTQHGSPRAGIGGRGGLAEADQINYV